MYLKWWLCLQLITSQYGTSPLPFDGSDLCMKLLNIFFASVCVHVCMYVLFNCDLRASKCTILIFSLYVSVVEMPCNAR